jgi:hypothetical protein
MEFNPVHNEGAHAPTVRLPRTGFTFVTTRSQIVMSEKPAKATTAPTTAMSESAAFARRFLSEFCEFMSVRQRDF